MKRRDVCFRIVSLVFENLEQFDLIESVEPKKPTGTKVHVQITTGPRAAVSNFTIPEQVLPTRSSLCIGTLYSMYRTAHVHISNVAARTHHGVKQNNNYDVSRQRWLNYVFCFCWTHRKELKASILLYLVSVSAPLGFCRQICNHD